MASSIAYFEDVYCYFSHFVNATKARASDLLTAVMVSVEPLELESE